LLFPVHAGISPAGSHGLNAIFNGGRKMKAVRKTANGFRAKKRNQQPSSGKSGGHPVDIRKDEQGEKEKQYQQQQQQQRPQQQQTQLSRSQYGQQQQQQ
jgi:hypothetical protein